MKKFPYLRLVLSALLLSVIAPLSAQAAPGDLYVGGLGAHVIYKFTPTGVKTTFASGSFTADSIAFDKNGNLFVSDTQNNRIVKITPGGIQTTFATGLTPAGLAFNSAGFLYAADSASGSIFKYAPDGSPGPPFAIGVSGPFGLVFDPSGNLFVSEVNTNSILKFTSAGVKTTFAMGFHQPLGIALAPSGDIYEVDFASGSIFKVSPAGMSSPFAVGLSAPRHIAVNPAGNVFATNFGTSEIFVFTPAGARTTFASGIGAGGLAFEPSNSRLSNISTRALVETGNHVLIGGFVISGSGGKQVLLRAIGPTLANSMVPNPLQDPVLSLHDTTMEIANNDNWQSAANSSQIPSALKPTDARESAILATLQPGSYTAIVSGKGGTSGVALVEVYDLQGAGSSQLANISTRGVVQTGDFVMIGGFISAGPAGSSTEVLIRAKGPSLAQFGITDALADPTLRVFNGNGVVINSNDNWKDTQQAQIAATGNAPTNDLESAILITLAPGNYTAIVSGKNGGTGVGQVEVFKQR